MGERKVMNKYYPPDFSERLRYLPKMRKPSSPKLKIRVMIPYTMRCLTCGHYMYSGTKFNANVEKVKSGGYLSLDIHRFYITCQSCSAVITYRSDPEINDYTVPENGAICTFRPERLSKQEGERIKRQKEEEADSLESLERRIKKSRREISVVDNLEALMDLKNRNVNVDHKQLISKLENDVYEEDETFIKKLFGSEANASKTIKRLPERDDESSIKEETLPTKKEKPSIHGGRQQNIHSLVRKRNRSADAIPVHASKNSALQLLSTCYDSDSSSDNI